MTKIRRRARRIHNLGFESGCFLRVSRVVASATLAILLFPLTACVEVSEFSNIRPMALVDAPAIKFFQDPDASFGRYRTFAVYPTESAGSAANPIAEKQLLFYVRSLFERSGYTFVGLNGSPDLLITAAVSTSYSETHVPPREKTELVWKPGYTVTSQTGTSGRVSATGHGGFAWGTYSGNSTTTTYVPGRLVTETRTEPGYSVGYYYPAASVWVFDAKTDQNVWYGVGTGASATEDVRISSQVVLSNLVDAMPYVPRTKEDLAQGFTGMYVSVVTVDGNTYFPYVWSLTAQSPAKLAGARQFDRIISIDGVDLRNKSFGEVETLLRGPVGSRITLQVERTSGRLSLAFDRVSAGAVGYTVQP